MLTDRIMGALTFRKTVYSEVESDESFTTTAWVIVAVVAFVSQLGSHAGVAGQSFGGWIGATVVGTIFAIIGFALSALIISWLGSSLFHAQVDFNEVVRTVGLAYIWNAVGFIGVLAIITPFLACLLTPVTILAWIASLAAALIAVKEALDLEWGETIITVVAAWIVGFIVSLVAGLVLGMMGLTAAGIFSALGS